LIYPKGPSKSFLSKNMMNFWANFAKTGKPGMSSNNQEWIKYNGLNEVDSNYMVLDNRKNLKMDKDQDSFKSLVNDLYYENEITDLEKCVVLLQMLTFVGDDLYDDYVDFYPGKCSRNDAEEFLKANASFIDY
jgi:hypothetical protein